ASVEFPASASTRGFRITAEVGGSSPPPPPLISAGMLIHESATTSSRERLGRISTRAGQSSVLIRGTSPAESGLRSAIRRGHAQLPDKSECLGRTQDAGLAIALCRDGPALRIVRRPGSPRLSPCRPSGRRQSPYRLS